MIVPTSVVEEEVVAVAVVVALVEEAGEGAVEAKDVVAVPAEARYLAVVVAAVVVADEEEVVDAGTDLPPQ